MIVINRIIVDKLPEGCSDCQLYQDNKCYGHIRDDYGAKAVKENMDQEDWNRRIDDEN